jgi:ABC-type branched-subunit amino acid transport system ATPase component
VDLVDGALPGVDRPRDGRSKLLVVKDLEVSYGQLQVLFDVDLEVAEGEVVALLGTNGAGKSTLLRAISGVTEAGFGAVVLDGRDITHAPPNEIAALGVAQVPGGAGCVPVADGGGEPAGGRLVDPP